MEGMPRFYLVLLQHVKIGEIVDQSKGTHMGRVCFIQLEELRVTPGVLCSCDFPRAKAAVTSTSLAENLSGVILEVYIKLAKFLKVGCSCLIMEVFNILAFQRDMAVGHIDVHTFVYRGSIFCILIL